MPIMMGILNILNINGKGEGKKTRLDFFYPYTHALIN